MADTIDPNPALRAELMAALAVIDPQIAGLVRLLAASTTPSSDPAMPTILQSPELQARFQAAYEGRESRRILLQAVVDALDAVVAARRRLHTNGYPNLDVLPLVPTLLDELRAERANLEAAIAQFQAATPETGDFHPQTAKVS